MTRNSTEECPCAVVGGSSDDSLVALLASLAAETSHDPTHETPQDITHETSPILTRDAAAAAAAADDDDDDDDDVNDFVASSQHVLPLSAEERREILEQSQEMSRRVWDDDVDLQQPPADAAADDDDYDYDMYVPQPLVFTWLGGVMVTVLDLGSSGHEFDLWSGRYQVVTTWMGDCLRTGKPSQCITSHQGQLSLSLLRGR